MMKILAIEKQVPGISVDQFQPYLGAEAERVWDLYQVGNLREFYFRQDQATAVLVLEYASVEEAQKVLDTLPLVREGLITFDVIPLRAYPGFARLFAAETSPIESDKKNDEST
jgi:hypothetical protein